MNHVRVFLPLSFLAAGLTEMHVHINETWEAYSCHCLACWGRVLIEKKGTERGAIPPPVPLGLPWLRIVPLISRSSALLSDRRLCQISPQEREA